MKYAPGVLISILLSLIAVPAAQAQPSVGAAEAAITKTRRIAVFCDRGQSLQDALSARPGEPLLVEFSGTCAENITIERDDLKLAGANAQATITGQVLVRGASRVVLEHFTVRETPIAGPLDRTAAAVRFLTSQQVAAYGLSIFDAAGHGLAFEAASGEAIDTTIERSGGIGFIAAVNAAVSIGGGFTLRDSVGNGLCVLDGAAVIAEADAVIVSERNPFGVVIEEGAGLTLADGAGLTANNNLGDGILLVRQGGMNFGLNTIEVRDNGRFGILATDLSRFLPNPNAAGVTITASGNAQGGIAATRGALVSLPPGTTSTGNGVGVAADEAILWLGGVVSRDNAAGDAFFFFGSKVSMLTLPNDFGVPPICDPTVLIRGGECVVPPPGAAVFGAPIDSWDTLPERARRALENLR